MPLVLAEDRDGRIAGGDRSEVGPPPELRRLGQPAEVLHRARQRLRSNTVGQEVEERAQQRRLPDRATLTGDDDRGPRLDEQPQERREVRVEHPLAQQADDRPGDRLVDRPLRGPGKRCRPRGQRGILGGHGRKHTPHRHARDPMRRPP